uniref:Protein hu-li tai shao n=1 Tax=Aceria tosichella TaxID=561515 RepID=A0A6G1SPR7_9ACAR
MATATQQTNESPIGDHSTQSAAVEQDIKEMERRKRVEMIMSSQLFREELERIIEGQFVPECSSLAGLSALHQVTELLQRGGFTSPTLRNGPAIIPINDIRGIDCVKYDKVEKLIRCKVAAVYRLVDLHGWSQNIYNHISARINQELEHFLINPFGLQYNEITASSLVKIDIQGNLIDQGSTNFLFNRAGFNLHASIHRARPDLKAIIHIHHPPVIAVSSFKKGLLPLCQEAAILGDVSYYDYTGILVDSDEQDAIAQALGVHNKVMILRNHGVVACGVDIEEAFFYLTNVVKACEVQVKLLPVGLDNLVFMSKEAVDRTQDVVRHSAVVGKDGDGSAEQAKTGSKRRLNVKEMDFEAHMRMLDNLGYRTGYVYKNPLVKREERLKYDVEEPPTVTSVQSNYFDEDKWLSPLKKLVDGKKTHDRISWVNSPNVYQKKEILETGTHDPRVITRWIQDGHTQNGQHYNHVKIDNAHQFAPHSLDVEEFKRKQKAMKELRMKNTVSSGPQSQILDGVTWDELKQAGTEGAEGQKGHEQTILVGAASKGIIQRDHQHDAKVYKTAYAKNPFDNISDAELEEYKRLVSRKQRGEEVPYEEIPENMRHLLTEPMMELLANTASPTSPMSDEESEKDKKKKDKDKKKKIRTPSFLRGGKTGKSDKEEERVEKREEKKDKEKEKKKDKKEKERA